MSRTRLRVGLLGRLLGILVMVVALDLVLSAAVFERANEFSLQAEDASRISDQLVVAYRMLDQTRPSARGEIAEELNTERFAVRWAQDAPRGAESLELDPLRRQILEREPDLMRASLRLHLEPIKNGRNIGGSMILSDRSVVSFTADVNEPWKFNPERIVLLLFPTVLLIIVGALLVRVAVQPLRKLVVATHKVGDDEPMPVPPSGSPEVRQLIHAFNIMQARIHQLIRNRQLAVSAIAHDLRTPLARLQMRLESGATEDSDREAMVADIAEMRMLLQSLQTFNEGHDYREPIERIDVASMVETLVDDSHDRGHDVVYHGPPRLEITARPMSLRRALSNLIENALHYAGNAEVLLHTEEQEVVLTVQDNGAGIDEGRLQDVLQPFVRLDEARSRDTPGMGLGLAIVDQIVRTEGGEFTLSNRPEGGLRAVIRLPMAARE